MRHHPERDGRRSAQCRAVGHRAEDRRPQARLLRVLAPLGVLLPNGLGLNVDGKDMGRVAFVRCLPNGCVAEVVLDDALLKNSSRARARSSWCSRHPKKASAFRSRSRLRRRLRAAALGRPMTPGSRQMRLTEAHVARVDAR